MAEESQRKKTPAGFRSASDLLLEAAKRDAARATQLATTLGDQVAENIEKSEQYRNAITEFQKIESEKSEMQSLAVFYEQLNQTSQQELTQMKTQLYKTVERAVSQPITNASNVQNFQNSNPVSIIPPSEIPADTTAIPLPQPYIPPQYKKKVSDIKKMLLLGLVTFLFTSLLSYLFISLNSGNKADSPKNIRPVPPTSYNNDFLQKEE